MFRWYEKAEVCHVLLLDYCSKDEYPADPTRPFASGPYVDEEKQARPVPDDVTTKVADSRWFTRGWTLQELLAPRTIYLYDSSGIQFGSKALLTQRLSLITGIAAVYLTGETPLSSASISCRMSWASRRENHPHGRHRLLPPRYLRHQHAPTLRPRSLCLPTSARTHY